MTQNRRAARAGSEIWTSQSAQPRTRRPWSNESPARPFVALAVMHKQKLVLIFDEKGQGKSTLNNLLLRGCDRVRYFKHGDEPLPCKTSDDYYACTKQIDEHELEEHELMLVDSPGIEDERDAQQFCALLNRVREDAVIAGIVILQSGRGSNTLEQFLEYVKHLLGAKVVKYNTLLLRTHENPRKKAEKAESQMREVGCIDQYPVPFANLRSLSSISGQPQVKFVSIRPCSSTAVYYSRSLQRTTSGNHKSHAGPNPDPLFLFGSLSGQYGQWRSPPRLKPLSSIPTK